MRLSKDIYETNINGNAKRVNLGERFSTKMTTII
jgi:hypothetical protein